MRVFLPSTIHTIGITPFIGTGLGQAVSPDFILPAGNGQALILEPEAFAGIDAGYVFIPAAVRQIPGRAFADCKNLRFVLIEYPYCVIAQDAFEGCENLTVIGQPSPAIMRLVEANDYQFVALPGDNG